MPATHRIFAGVSGSPPSQTETDSPDASDRAHHRTVRRRRLIALLSVLVLGLATATALAVHAHQQAAQQRAIVISGLLIRQSQQLRGTSPVLARLLSVAAWRINPSPAARYAMLVLGARPGITAVLESTGGAVTSVAFGRDGTLATGNADGTAGLWNMASHRQIATLTGPAGPLNAVAFSADGKTLAAGGAAARVRLWDVATHRPGWSLPTGPTGPVSSVAFSPDGTTVAAGSAHGVWMWGLPSQCGCLTHPTPAGQLTGPTGPVSSVAFSPVGKTLAASSGGTVALWDMTTQPAGTLTRHHGTLISVAFSPDGTTLAAGSGDGTVQLWDMATHRQLATLTGPTSPVTSVAFSRDGKTLATGSTGHTIRLWDVAYLTNPVPRLCAATGRSLTRAEWARYVPVLAYQKVCP